MGAYLVKWTGVRICKGVVQRKAAEVHNVAVPCSIWAAIVVGAIAVGDAKITSHIAHTVVGIIAVIARDGISWHALGQDIEADEHNRDLNET